MPQPKRDLFIDCHCHLFNAADIPLYATARQQLRTLGLPARLLAPLALAIPGAPKLALNRFRGFVKFFDEPIDKNIESLVPMIRQTVGSGRPIILTPLVMDFEKVHESGKPPSRQLERLRRAIKKAERVLLDNDCRILPFLGYDLRKLVGEDDLAAFKRSWSKFPVNAPVGELKSGNVIGLKLYPPMGFRPYPKRGTNQLYLDFYGWCAERRIPITAHVQKDSYEGYSKKRGDYKKPRVFADPAYWVRVLDAVGNLRINFAHFGGEKDVVDTAFQSPNKKRKTLKQQERKELSRKTWTYTIITLLKKYDHTYADLGAFNYSMQRASPALARLLLRDGEGSFDSLPGMEDGSHKLKDKLLWGSDLPMVYPLKFAMNDKNEWQYQKYYDGFREAIRKESGLNLGAITTALTCTNPKRFLFSS